MATPAMMQTLTGCTTIERNMPGDDGAGRLQTEADAERNAVDSLHPGDEVHRSDVEHRIEEQEGGEVHGESRIVPPARPATKRMRKRGGR